MLSNEGALDFTPDENMNLDHLVSILSIIRNYFVKENEKRFSGRSLHMKITFLKR